MNIVNAIIAFFKKLFTQPQPATKPSEPTKPEVVLPVEPVKVPETKPTGDIDWDAWTKQAMIISGSFEGEGTDWGNPVGNFDGAYLTCGLLGFTWQYNNQIPMIKSFVAKYGLNRLIALMPTTGYEYWSAVGKGETAGGAVVASWSSGANVREPYRSELRRFWSSDEMKGIQITTSWDMMGVWARSRSVIAKEYFKLEQPLFQHFEYYFDQAVLNGQGGYIDLEKADKEPMSNVMEFCQTKTGYLKDDLRKNASLWADLVLIADPHEVTLFKAAYLRAIKSRSEFQPVTMCRRGALALGAGYVNGQLRKYSWLNQK